MYCTNGSKLFSWSSRGIWLQRSHFYPVGMVPYSNHLNNGNLILPTDQVFVSDSISICILFLIFQKHIIRLYLQKSIKKERKKLLSFNGAIDSLGTHNNHHNVLYTDTCRFPHSWIRFLFMVRLESPTLHINWTREIMTSNDSANAMAAQTRYQMAECMLYSYYYYYIIAIAIAIARDIVFLFTLNVLKNE